MKILYISQYYPPEANAPAIRVSELARLWCELGHEVTVLTGFPQHPNGVKRPDDVGVLYRRERDGAVEVVRSYVLAAPNSGIVRRGLSYGSFALSALLASSWKVGRPEVVIATSPQLLTGVAGWCISRLKRTPFVFEVRDLWPESLAAVGLNVGRTVNRILEWLADRLYRTASAVVTVGESYRDEIVNRYRIDAAKIKVIPNGVDSAALSFDDDLRRQLRAAYGWSEKFVAMYVGTIGLAHGLETLIEAAAQLRHRCDLQFVLVGDGAERASLESLARQRRLTNVAFLGQQPRERIGGLYAAADACVVTLRRAELFHSVLPSKMFEVLAMQRPMVLAVEGAARRLVEAADAALCIAPEDPGALAAALTALESDPLGARWRAANGRRLVAAQFDRKTLAAEYLDVLAAVVRRAACSHRESACHRVRKEERLSCESTVPKRLYEGSALHRHDGSGEGIEKSRHTLEPLGVGSAATVGDR